MRIDSIDELPAVLAEFGFPFVLKPTTSWTAAIGDPPAVPVEVIDEAEAVAATRSSWPRAPASSHSNGRAAAARE